MPSHFNHFFIQLDERSLDDTIAYVQMTHVVPFIAPGEVTPDEADFYMHTNVKQFSYEAAMIDDSVAVEAPLAARQALRRVCLTGSNLHRKPLL